MNPCACGNTLQWELHLNGTASCMECGTLCVNEEFDNMGGENFMHSFQSMSVLCQTQTYTRAKRFKKYLARACMRQSNNSVPDQTWKYLLDRRPYKGPRHILRVLKGAGRTLRKKCYDCLPMLVHHLCDIKVPVLSDVEVAVAVELFKAIDAAFPKEGGFMSYAYALEFILCKMNREDLLPFLSRIQCTKRRAHYQQLLTRVFKGELVGETRLVSGQTLSDFGSKAATVVSDTTAALAQTLLPRGSIDLQSLVGLVQCISD